MNGWIDVTTVQDAQQNRQMVREEFITAVQEDADGNASLMVGMDNEIVMVETVTPYAEVVAQLVPPLYVRSADGTFTKADKMKLDGIEVGATANHGTGNITVPCKCGRRGDL